MSSLNSRSLASANSKKMRHYLLASVALTFTLTTQAQNEGTIQYQTTRDMHVALIGTPGEAYKDFIPQYQTSENTLVFNENESLFQSVVDETSEEVHTEEMQSGNVQIEIDMSDGSSEDNKTYYDRSTNTVIEQRDFMGKLFLIQDESESMDWKVTEETDTILDKVCTKATAEMKGNKNGQDVDIDIEAWFSSEIPVSLGPGSYRGLPGMILKVDFDNGFEIIEATEIDLSAIKKSALQKPNKGKKVTSEEYQAIVEERMKMMQEQFGGSDNGNGNVFIIEERN